MVCSSITSSQAAGPRTVIVIYKGEAVDKELKKHRTPITIESKERLVLRATAKLQKQFFNACNTTAERKAYILAINIPTPAPQELSCDPFTPIERLLSGQPIEVIDVAHWQCGFTHDGLVWYACSERVLGTVVNSLREGLASVQLTRRALREITNAQLPQGDRVAIAGECGGLRAITDALRAHPGSPEVAREALRASAAICTETPLTAAGRAAAQALAAEAVTAMEAHAGAFVVQNAGSYAVARLVGAGAELHGGAALQAVRRLVAFLGQCTEPGAFGRQPGGEDGVAGAGCACWALGALFGGPGAGAPVVQAEVAARSAAVEALAAALRAGSTALSPRHDIVCMRACAALEALCARGEPPTVARVAQPATVQALLALARSARRDTGEAAAARRSALGALSHAVARGSADDRAVVLAAQTAGGDRRGLLDLLDEHRDSLDAQRAATACRAVAVAAARDIPRGHQRALSAGLCERLLDRFRAVPAVAAEALGAFDALAALLLLPPGGGEAGNADPIDDRPLWDVLRRPVLRRLIDSSARRSGLPAAAGAAADSSLHRIDVAEATEAQRHASRSAPAAHAPPGAPDPLASPSEHRGDSDSDDDFPILPE
eukprot:m51a1_g7663 hypothetical protein (607) ;mRNA; f:425034-443591